MAVDLSSATASAIAFGDWVASRLDCPGKPLKYLDVVISQAADSDPKVLDEARTSFKKLNPLWDFETAHFATVDSAIRQWNDRIDKNYDDVALLFFCGHGIEVQGVPALFTQDFDAVQENWHHLVAIKDFFDATSKLRARNKYFFIDSCRELPSRLSGLARLPANPIIAPDLNASHRYDARLWMATRESKRAFGRGNQPSQFTSALLDALDGVAAQSHRIDGSGNWQWAVNSTRVLDVVGKILAHQRALEKSLNGTEPPYQEPQDLGEASAQGEVFHLPGNRARILGDLSWTPGDATIAFHPFGNPQPPAFFTSQPGGSHIGAIPLPPPAASPAICAVAATSNGSAKVVNPPMIVVQPDILRSQFQLS
jgi:hypothetical protein